MRERLMVKRPKVPEFLSARLSPSSGTDVGEEGSAPAANAAIYAVQTGARACTLQVIYAPGRNERHRHIVDTKSP